MNSNEANEKHNFYHEKKKKNWFQEERGQELEQLGVYFTLFSCTTQH